MSKKIIALFTIIAVAAGMFCLPAAASSQTLPGDIVLADEDFSDGFTLNQAYTGAQMEELSDLYFISNMPANHWPDKTNAYFTVKPKDAQDASKGNYLEVGSPKDDSHAMVMADFADVETGTIVTEMKIRPTSGRRTKYYNSMLGADSSYKHTLYGVNTSDSVVWSYGIFPSWQVQLTPGEDGFCSVKTVWSRAQATDNWSVDLYDMIADRKLISYTTGGEETLTSGFVPSAIVFYNNWQVAADAEVSVDIADLKCYIPADVSLTQDGAYDSMEKTISYTVSEALDETSVNSTNIKVTSPNGQDVTVNPSWDLSQQKITLSFPYGLPENGDYTVSFAAAKTLRGFNVNKSAVFTGEKTIMPLEVASVTPNGGTVQNTIGEIKIVFSREIDESTISEVSFTKANGDPITGYSEKTVDRNTVTISFGTLTVGDYLLTIGTGVKAKDDDQYLSGERLIPFTAEETIDLSEDFSSDSYETDRAYSGAELSAINDSITFKNEGTYTVEEIDGDKAITLRPTAVNSGPGITVDLDNNLEVGTLELNLMLKRSSGNMMTNLFSLTDSAGKTIMTLEATNGGTSLTISQNSARVDGTIYGSPTTDSEGFMSLEIIAKRNKKQEDWDFKIVDALTGSDVFAVQIPADRLADIKTVGVLSIYTLKDAELSESLSISNLSLNLKHFSKVLISDCDNALPTVETLNLLIDSDISSETIKATVFEKNDETVKIDATVNYVTEERKVQVNLLSYLDFGKDYVVSFENAEIADYEFSTVAAPLSVESKTVSYYDANGALITEPAEDAAYKAVYDISVSNPAQEAKNLLLGLVSYNAEGKINSKLIKLVNSSQSTITDSIYLEGLTKADVKEVKCFIWELTSTGFEPVAK